MTRNDAFRTRVARIGLRRAPAPRIRDPWRINYGPPDLCLRNGQACQRCTGGGAKVSRTADEKEDVHQHSGWLIPLAVAFAILLLSGLFLGWYLRPGPRPQSGAP